MELIAPRSPVKMSPSNICNDGRIVRLVDWYNTRQISKKTNFVSLDRHTAERNCSKTTHSSNHFIQHRLWTLDFIIPFSRFYYPFLILLGLDD